MRQGRQKKSGASNAYLISFGDTMTALLAFFIVLNALASEQTGANLHAGTGSFVRATDSLGVPGIFAEGLSSYSVQLQNPSPLYLVETTDPDSDHQTGADSQGDSIYVRDRELENFERMLHELERVHRLDRGRATVGEVSFDRMTPFPDGRKVIDKEMELLLAQLLPAFGRASATVELIVWTPTPSNSAWQRSATLAHSLRSDVAKHLHLSASEQSRFSASSRQWIASDVKRPVLSFVVREKK